MRAKVLTILLLLLLLPSVLQAQTRKISINAKNQTVAQVMKEIEQKSGFTFLYKDDAVDTKRRVSVSATDEDVLEILKKVFAGTSTEAEIVNRNINLVKSNKPAAQSSRPVRVSGTIRDAAGPVVGAVIQAGDVHAITDGNGNFSLSVPSNASLEVSCLGYATQQIPVNGRGKIDILLEEDAVVLQEAVALGYGAQTKKKDLSASVGIVNNAEQLAARPVTSTTNMLQGQIPGVFVTAEGGNPNASPSLLIRGQGSQNGDSVLWVVDGVPGAPVVSMNDIESIVVLKDAASAAIYGATSGAGGVILVTTKRASQGVHVEYNLVSGFRALSNLPVALDAEQLIEMRKISITAAGGKVGPEYDVANNPWIGVTRTNWMKEITRNAFYQRHEVVANYGSEKFKGRLIFNYQDNQGVIINTFSKDLGVRFNGEFQVNKWVKLTEDASVTYNTNRSANTGSDIYGVIMEAIYMPPCSELIQSSGPLKGHWGGSFTEDPDYVATYGNYAGMYDGDNPVRQLCEQTMWGGSTAIWSTTGLELANFVKGLKIRSQFSYNLNQSMTKNFKPRVKELGAVDDSNTLNWNAGRSDIWRSESTVTYDRTFGKHTVGALGAVTFDHYVSRGFGLSGVGFDNEEEYVQYIKYAKDKNGSDSYVEDANIAFVGRLAYSFDDRYFVTASYRRDYAGRLPEGHEYGDFPAVTGAWKVSSEPFFPKNDIVNLLKVRASWGRIGNLGSVPRHYKSATMSSGSAAWQSRGAIWGVETGERWGNFQWPGKTVNQTLTWETSQQMDVGFDLDMFRDRLSLSVDLYDKLTYNLIQDQSTGWPNTIGWNPMKVNQGKIRNRGVELSMAWNQRLSRDFYYSVSGNYAFNDNRVLTTGMFDDNGNEAPWSGGGSFGMVPWLYQTEPGQPLNSFYVIKTDGIFQSEQDVLLHNKDGKLIQPAAVPGDLKFVDYNDDGKIDNADRQYVGSSIPKHTFALTADLNWKGFNLNMMWQGVAGNKIAYVGKSRIMCDLDGSYNRSIETLTNSWTPENPTATNPRLSQSDPNLNWSTASDFYIEDGSYLRLKNLTLGYDFTRLLRKVPHFGERGSSLNVYVSVENLLTITKYSGMDPELGLGGRDTLTYPVSKIYAFGIKLNY